jgi:hypothetical protein
MQTPFRWTWLYAGFALWGASAAALAEPVVSTPAPATRIGSLLFDRKVLALLAIGCLLGMIIGWIGRDPREPQLRLVNKPKKTPLPVLVPPGPAPRLIPGDCPNATRPRSTRAPVPRQTPVGAARPRVIDYLAAFADPPETGEGGRVDFLLVSSDSEDGALDPPGGQES